MDKNTIIKNLNKMEELYEGTSCSLGTRMSTYFFEPYYTSIYDNRNWETSVAPDDNACGIYYFLPEKEIDAWDETDEYDWDSDKRFNELVKIASRTDKPNEIAMTLEAGYDELSKEMLKEVKKYQKKYADNDKVEIEISDNSVYIGVEVSLDDMSASDAFIDIGYELIPWLSNDFSKTL